MIKKENDWRLREGITRDLTPNLTPNELKKLKNILRLAMDASSSASLIEKHAKLSGDLRKIAEKKKSKRTTTKFLAVISIYADLFEQGWLLTDIDKLILQPPGQYIQEEESYQSVKDRLRTYLQSVQVKQLKEPSVQKFIARMYNKTTARSSNKSHSIDSVIDDGNELATLLEKANAMDVDEREAYLSRIIKPEIEICNARVRCDKTGLKLSDIWRFFRHTWLTEYRTAPGRQMSILIRNAARKNRPVMGIAMLASPIMRLKVRDKWIGWQVDEVTNGLLDGDINEIAFIEVLYKRLDDSINNIRWDDFLSKKDIKNPQPDHIDKLDRLTIKAKNQREKILKEKASGGDYNENLFKNSDMEKVTKKEWLALSEDNLFVQKRASTLSKLLKAKYLLGRVDLIKNPKNIRHFVKSKDGIQVLETVLREFRKEGLSSQIMDISVCGAVPPYGGLIVGKLVTLLLSSAEVDDAFRKRYGSMPSVIASQMAGRPIIRDATLRILTTTSLFGVGTSQYNRLSIKSAEHRGIPDDIIWEKLGEQSAGYGTLHLSNETLQLLRAVGIQRHGAQRINSRFGEGTSARMRQATEGLNALGLESGQVLHHATPRIVLGCQVDKNARNTLLGLSDSKSQKKPTTKAIARAWRRRWLVNRVSNPDVISRVRSEGSEYLRNKLVIQK